MFDMKTIGLKISELRKEKNMTQMELADKMNISFQAVSNWERGNSMPDVSKLPELAQIFNVTVDDLLNEQSALINSAAKENLSEYLNSNMVSVRELQQSAPILKPAQIKEVVTHMQIQSLDEIGFIFPFIDKSVLYELAVKAVDKDDESGIVSVVPFLNQEDIDQIAVKMISKNKNINGFAPFISKSVLTEYAENIYNEYGLSALGGIVAFLPKEALIKIAEKEYMTHSLENFVILAPYLDNAYLNKLAESALQKEGISAICPIAPFLDKKMLSDIVKEIY